MNELQAIVEAYAKARARGERAALATIVSVVGSAYRRSGARMLITDGGHTVGTISGGCLERDVIERAADVMDSGAARIIEYDTRGDDDILWGLGAGCHGVVRILLESLHAESDGAQSLRFIESCLEARHSGVIATLINPEGTSDAHNKPNKHRIGARFLLADEQDAVTKSFGGNEIDRLIREDAREVLACGRARIGFYETGVEQLEIFFDLIKPPRALIVFGAEQDALPVVRLARTLGWHVTVVDTRARRATPERFSVANEVILCRADDIASRLPPTRDAAAIVMTHNFPEDITLLRHLLPLQTAYFGILGSKYRTAKLLEELAASDAHLNLVQLARLHSPAGLDIGAETPEEIALSIIAEIKAEFAKRGGGFLRDRNAPIHDSCVVDNTSDFLPLPSHTQSENESPAVCRLS